MRNAERRFKNKEVGIRSRTLMLLLMRLDTIYLILDTNKSCL